MNTIVKIRGIDYYANKRRTGRRSDCFDAVFRPVGKRNGEIVLHDCITKTTGGVGGGMGPFGSPVRFVPMFEVKGWGKVATIDQRAWQHLADMVV